MYTRKNTHNYPNTTTTSTIKLIFGALAMEKGGEGFSKLKLLVKLSFSYLKLLLALPETYTFS
jgi:hypothetical protein